MPTPCPSRLKELIALANLEPDSETRKTLQAIARAFQAKRAKSKRAPAVFEIQTQNALKLNLADGRIEVVREEIEIALFQVQPPSNIGLIRECPVCPEIFWAERDDTVACSPRHAERWRKREQRRKKGEREAKRVIDRARRKKRKAQTPFRLSITTATILDAVFDRYRTTEHIADYCYINLYKDKYSTSVFSGVYKKVNVDRGLTALEEAGYLTAGEEQEEENRHYAPTEKARRLRREMLHPATKHHYFRYAVLEPPTH